MAEEKKELTEEKLNKVIGGRSDYEKYKPMFDLCAKNSKDEDMFVKVARQRTNMAWPDEYLREIYRKYYANKAR
jgi:bacteriocin-like protein